MQQLQEFMRQKKAVQNRMQVIMDLKEGHIMHEQMYPSFLNADCECPLYLVIYAFFSA